MHCTQHPEFGAKKDVQALQNLERSNVFFITCAARVSTRLETWMRMNQQLATWDGDNRSQQNAATARIAQLADARRQAKVTVPKAERIALHITDLLAYQVITCTLPSACTANRSNPSQRTTRDTAVRKEPKVRQSRTTYLLTKYF